MKIQYQDSHLVVFESALFRTTCSLIMDKGYIILVDPNWFPIELDAIESFIEQLNHKGDKFLLFTHSDYDHIIGYHQFKSYQKIASQNFVNNTDHQSILDQINTLDDDNYVRRDYQVVYPTIDIAIGQTEDAKEFGNDQYLFYQARGHNKDGLITFNKSKGILIVGDYLSNIEFPYLYDSFELYKATLDTLEKIILEQNIKILVSGHGDITNEKTEMTKRINDSRAYIRDLEKSVRENTSFDLDTLLSKYDFPIVMTKFHNKNIELLKRELGL